MTLVSQMKKTADGKMKYSFRPHKGKWGSQCACPFSVPLPPPQVEGVQVKGAHAPCVFSFPCPCLVPPVWHPQEPSNPEWSTFSSNHHQHLPGIRRTLGSRSLAGTTLPCRCPYILPLRWLSSLRTMGTVPRVWGSEEDLRVWISSPPPVVMWIGTSWSFQKRRFSIKIRAF